MKAPEQRPPLGPPNRHGVRVGYVDTDLARVVHHSTYLKYFEAGRVEFLRSRGIVIPEVEGLDELGLPVLDLQVRYRGAARFDDWLEIETWVSEATRAKVRFEYRVWRGTEVLTEASTLLVCVDLRTGRIRTMPDPIRLAFSR